MSMRYRCFATFVKKSSPLSRGVVKQKYVPKSEEPTKEMVDTLQTFLNSHKKLLLLTGAGFSTESGIPDYRSEDVGLYARKSYKPLQYQDFLESKTLRQRYWARSYVGWPGYSALKPSSNHHIVKDWETKGLVHWLVTQNVDHLHVKAGSKNVTELHGTLYNVGCLSCGHTVTRNNYQCEIQHHNPVWSVQSFEIATDGDVFLTDEQICGFKVPACQNCGGDMKPHIVFFGDNVPRHTVELVHEKLRESEAVVVIGSSLQVYSGYRFLLAAHEQRKPIAILNIGETRADKLASLKIDAQVGQILPLLHIQESCCASVDNS